jgi:hypothetical protein
MKEYKVIKPKLGIRNRFEKLQEVLNQYAREGWIVNHVAQSAYFVILERDKNR